jgi:hypothetical protein
MIRKKSNAYKYIKANIGRLTLIQQATGIAPGRLVNLFLKNLPDKDLLIKKKTKDEYWTTEPLSEGSAYKYFKRASNTYLEEVESNPSYDTLMDSFKETYLKKDYFGQDFSELLNTYRSEEKAVKEFVKDAFEQVFPITPDMNPKQMAIRNQKLGKISNQHWIGDITNYDYFQQAPGFMMKRVEQAIKMIELYVANLLNEKNLEYEVMKLTTNQRLVDKLQPKQLQSLNKTTIHKI